MNKDLEKNIAKQLEEVNAELYNISWEKLFGTKVLRIIINQKDKALNMERIIQISKFLGSYLEENEPTEGEYNLEVLSAGIERELLNLTHWEASIGKLVFVLLKNPINNVKKIIGFVESIKGKEITIKISDENENIYKLSLKDIKEANWAYNKEEKQDVR